MQIWKSIVVTSVLASGCATIAPPTAQIAGAEHSVQSATDMGAAFVDGASGYLRSANDELASAHHLSTNGQQERARSMAMRAQADADLAAQLAREASMRGTGHGVAAATSESANER